MTLSFQLFVKVAESTNELTKDKKGVLNAGTVHHQLKELNIL